MIPAPFGQRQSPSFDEVAAMLEHRMPRLLRKLEAPRLLPA